MARSLQVKAEKAPGYFEIVKRPMDLSTVLVRESWKTHRLAAFALQQKLRKNEYKTTAGVAEDVRQASAVSRIL